MRDAGDKFAWKRRRAALDGLAARLAGCGGALDARDAGVLAVAEISVGINRRSTADPGYLTKPKSNSFCIILEPLILASRVLDG